MNSMLFIFQLCVWVASSSRFMGGIDYTGATGVGRLMQRVPGDHHGRRLGCMSLLGRITVYELMTRRTDRSPMCRGCNGKAQGVIGEERISLAVSRLLQLVVQGPPCADELGDILNIM